MTIDEAKSMLIAKANCIDNQCKGIYEDCNKSLCDNCDLCYAQGTNGEQIKLLRQCAEWLEELKAYRTLDKTNFSDGFNKAIDDFADRLKQENKETLPTHSGFCKMNFDEVVDEIAEQLKAGDNND